MDITVENVFPDGPSSNPIQPSKALIRSYFRQFETAVDAGLSNGGLIYDTKANMDADLAHDANASAWVITGDDAGIYRKSGASGAGSWTRIADLPYSFIRASNAGAGTANAIQATTSIPIPAGDGAAEIVLNITENNTGPATVSFNGGSALTIKTASGADVQEDYLVAGGVVSGYVVGSTFQLTSEVGTAAAAAAAQAAADAAVQAASGVVSTQKSSTYATASYHPAVAPDFIQTAGYAAAGDGGGALYKKVASEPSHEGKFSITLDDGTTMVWYELAELTPNPRMFGAVGDDATDDAVAFQDTIDFVLAQGGGSIFVPNGTYWFPTTGDSLDPGTGNLRFYGEDWDNTILHFDEGTGAGVNDANAHSLFVNTDDIEKGSLTFEAIQFKGTFDGDEASRGGSSFWCDYYSSVSLEGCKVKDISHVSMDFHFLGRFVCRFNHFENGARDFIRCRDTPNQVVIGNYGLRNGDDAVALHTNDAAIGSFPTREGLIVTNNHFVNTGEIRLLGARLAQVANNRMTLPNTAAISISSASSFSEGDLPIFDIQVTNNIIDNLINIPSGASPSSGGAAIVFFGPAPRGSTGTHSTIPGRYDTTAAAFVFPWDYADVNTNDTANPVAPIPGVVVTGNIIRRTLPAVAAFSDYGFGKNLRTAGSSDPAITDANLRQAVGIAIYGGGLHHAKISGNVIEHLSTAVSFAAPTSNFDYLDVIVEANSFFNCRDRGVYVNSTAYRADITIRGNTINCDPYRQNANSNIDGTYDADATPEGVNSGSVKGLTIVGNDFRNCCDPVQSNNPNDLDIRDNTIHMGTPASAGFSTSHKGVGVVNLPGPNYRYCIEDCDPTSATYGQITTSQYASASAQPASGTWLRGAFVRNTSPTLDANNMTIMGWLRATTGSNNVAGTDWIAVRVSHVSPAT